MSGERADEAERPEAEPPADERKGVPLCVKSRWIPLQGETRFSGNRVKTKTTEEEAEAQSLSLLLTRSVMSFCVTGGAACCYTHPDKTTAETELKQWGTMTPSGCSNVSEQGNGVCVCACVSACPKPH